MLPVNITPKRNPFHDGRSCHPVIYTHFIEVRMLKMAQHFVHSQHYTK